MNAVGESNNENNFSHKLLLTSTQFSKIRTAFANGSSANTKLSKTQSHKIGQSGGFLGRLLEPSLRTGSPLIENVLKPLTGSVLIQLGLTAAAAAAATDAVIYKKMFRSSTTTLRISNKEMNDIMKVIKSLEEPGSLIKGVSETIKNEAKEQKVGFFSMLLGTLGACLLGNLLTGKGAIRAGERAIAANQGCKANMPGRSTIRACKGTIRAGQDF